jgi:hypothetical protein
MTRSIVRLVLTSLAFVLLFAGSLNLNRATASAVAPAGKCQDYCGCPGGTYVCCIIHLPDGTDIECGMP